MENAPNIALDKKGSTQSCIDSVIPIMGPNNAEETIEIIN